MCINHERSPSSSAHPIALTQAETISMEYELTLLKKLWLVIFRTYPENPILVIGLKGFIPEEFYTKIREYKSISIHDAVEAVKTYSNIRYVLETTINKIKNDWLLLTPATKMEILQLSSEPEISNYFYWLRNLSKDDEEDLRIKWYAADSLFYEMKREAIINLKKIGYDITLGKVDFTKSSFEKTISDVSTIFQHLAYYKIEADIAVVNIETPNSRYKYFNKIENRARIEIQPIYVGFQNTIRSVIKETSEGMYEDKFWLPSPKLEKILSEFREPIISIISSSNALEPQSEIYIKLKKIIHGDITMQNFTLSNSQIGVLNTGTIQNMDAKVNILLNSSNPEIGANFREFIQAVISNDEVVSDKKNEVLELLNELSDQVSVPKEKRKNAVNQAMLAQIGSIIGGINSLSELWEKFKFVITDLFGI